MTTATAICTDIRPILAEVAAELSKLTGQEWKASSRRQPWKDPIEEPDAKRYGYLTGPDEQTLYMGHYEPWGSKAEYFHVDCNWVWDKKNQVHTPNRYREEIRNLTLDINVSASKTPQRIAADIHRRLLPGYVVALASCKASRDAADKHEADALEGFATLAGIMGQPTEPPANRPDWRRVDVGPFDLTPQGETYRLEHASLTRAQAVTLALWFSGKTEEELLTIAGLIAERGDFESKGLASRLRAVAAHFHIPPPDPAAE